MDTLRDFPPWTFTVVLLLGGCASLDPKADYEEAKTLVEQRSGWRPDWSAPWSDTVAAWDGQSALGVDQAVTVALQNNRRLRADLEGIAAARADLVQSGLLPNPVLSATFAVPISAPQGTVTSVSASLVQELADLWLRPARKEAAASALREQILRASDEALRLVADVRGAHARLVSTQRSIALRRSHIDLLDRSIGVTRQRIAAGEASELDVNRLRQLRLGLEADLVRQELEREKQKRAVLEVLGLAGAGAEWEAQDVIPPLEMSSGLSEAELIALATSQRLDVAAARKVYQTRIAELRVANLGSLPDLGAGPAYQRDEEGREGLGAEVNLEVPIFDTNRARVAKAMSELRRAQAEADSVRQQAIAQARTAWLDARKSLELASFYQQQVIALATDNRRLAEQAFRAGQVDMTVVLETQREHIVAELELNRLQSAAALGLIELEYAVGGRLERIETTAEGAALKGAAAWVRASGGKAGS